MSWQATGWAKKTRGHATSAEKLLLLILADYADPDSWLCWPSQQVLADDMETSVRTVQRALETLEDYGFITQLRHGNQYACAIYRLNGDVEHIGIDALANDKLSQALPEDDRDVICSTKSADDTHVVSRPKQATQASLAKSAHQVEQATPVSRESDTGVALVDKRRSVGGSTISDQREGSSSRHRARRPSSTPDPQAEQLWRKTLEVLEAEMTRGNFDTWVRPLVGLSLSGDCLIVGAPSEYACDWLHARLAELISRRSSELAGRSLRVEVVVAA